MTAMPPPHPNDALPAVDLLSPALLDLARNIPPARVRKSAAAGDDARRLARKAALKAALAAGSLALPTGPLGWLTLLPELRLVWKIQIQLVSDIAALHGKKSGLTQEQVLYCLFRHSALQAFRDLVARVGERFVVRKASAQLIQHLVRRLALRLTQRVVGKGVARWLPVAGAVGVGAYAYHETSRVAETAIELFGAEIEVDGAGES
ncbi:MAG: EcsC family protein [Burkholderiales bacterium]|nr:EcsC family protein [Burkholderiales bacterium]